MAKTTTKTTRNEAERMEAEPVCELTMLSGLKLSYGE